MEIAVIEHLKLIQGVVNRLAQNSFTYKGWSITIVVAIFALAAKEATPVYLLVAILPAVTFWGLDAYYLRQERLFRKLYDGIRKADNRSLADGSFTMDTSPYIGDVQTWLRTCVSGTIFWLYFPMLVIVLVVFAITNQPNCCCVCR